MAAIADCSSEQDARLFINLVKQRFHGRKAHTFHQFKALFPKDDEQNWLSNEAMLTRVESIFVGNDYLIRRFKSFLPNPTNSSDSDSDNGGGPDNTQSMLHAMKLVNKVIEKGDKELFQSCVNLVKRFRKNKKAALFQKNLFALLIKYPDLKIDLSECLAEGMESRSGPKRLEKQKEMVSEGEDELFDRDLLFHRIRFAKQACERLISDNINQDMEEFVNVRNYFTALDISFLRENRMMAVSRLFSNGFQSRRRAVQDCTEIVCYLESKVTESMTGWTEEKEKAYRNVIDQEEEIPMWDWQTARIN